MKEISSKHYAFKKMMLALLVAQTANVNISHASLSDNEDDERRHQRRADLRSLARGKKDRAVKIVSSRVVTGEQFDSICGAYSRLFFEKRRHPHASELYSLVVNRLNAGGDKHLKSALKVAIKPFLSPHTRMFSDPDQNLRVRMVRGELREAEAFATGSSSATLIDSHSSDSASDDEAENVVNMLVELASSTEVSPSSSEVGPSSSIASPNTEQVAELGVLPGTQWPFSDDVAHAAQIKASLKMSRDEEISFLKAYYNRFVDHDLFRAAFVDLVAGRDLDPGNVEHVKSLWNIMKANRDFLTAANGGVAKKNGLFTRTRDILNEIADRNALYRNYLRKFLEKVVGIDNPEIATINREIRTQLEFNDMTFATTRPGYNSSWTEDKQVKLAKQISKMIKKAKEEGKRFRSLITFYEYALPSVQSKFPGLRTAESLAMRVKRSASQTTVLFKSDDLSRRYKKLLKKITALSR